MTNSRILTISACCLLLCTFFFSSCKVDKVEQNLSTETFSLRNATECRLFYHGIVREATDLKPLANARVSLKEYGLSTITDIDGKFNLEIKVNLDEIDFWEGPKMVKVTSANYLTSTIEIDFSQYFNPQDCGNINATKIEAEIIMSPIRKAVALTPRGGDFLFRDTMRSKCASPSSYIENHFLLWLPKIDMPEKERMMTITPRNIGQTFGTLDVPSGIVFRFDAEPYGMTFDKPAMLKFKPFRKDIPDGALYDHYTLNRETNRWEIEEESFFGFMEDGTLVLSFARFAEHLITYRPGIIIETDSLRYKRLATESILNCNCGDTKLMKREVIVEDQMDERLMIEGEDEMDEWALRMLLADLRNTLNIPSFAGESEFRCSRVGQENTAEVLYDYNRDMILEGTVDKCSRKAFFIQEQIRDISGTMNGKRFEYSTIVAIDCGEETLRCPTSTNCHQGCPD